MTIDTQTLLQHIRNHEGQTRCMLAENFEASEHEMARALAALEAAGAIVKVGQAYYAAGPRSAA